MNQFIFYQTHNVFVTQVTLYLYYELTKINCNNVIIFTKIPLQPFIKNNVFNINFQLTNTTLKV